MKIIKLLILFFLTYNLNNAQVLDEVNEDATDVLKTRIELIARPGENEIKLRWLVDKLSLWIAGNRDGYIIERAVKNSNGIISEFKKITGEPIKPWTKEKWEDHFRNLPSGYDMLKKHYEEMAYSFIYDDDSAIDNNDSSESFLDEIKDTRNLNAWTFIFKYLAAGRSVIAAEGMGVGYTDKDVKKGETYIYRISPAVENTDYQIEKNIVEVKAAEYEPVKSFEQLSIIEDDSKIGLNWTESDLNFGFYIERAADGKNFERISGYPEFISQKTEDSLIYGYFLDSNIQNYKEYTYRVYSLTHFADEDLIGEVKGMGRDKTPPLPPFVPQPQQIDARKVLVKWEMPNGIPNDLAGFKVCRDSSTAGVYPCLHEKMLPPDTREFTDNSFYEDSPNYYKVQAYDTAGNYSENLPSYVVIKDTIPPGKPQWVSADIDTNGVVYLVIKQNPERDIMGYKLLRANAPDHEFSSFLESYGEDTIDYTSITSFTDTVTLNSLTKNIYYRFTALDRNYNESVMSDIIAVKRPDIVPPSAPVITDVSVDEKIITVTYIPSTSEDVDYHIMNRRIYGDKSWETTRLTSKENVYTDKNAITNVMYEYSVTAVDSSGLQSEMSFPITAKLKFSGVLNPVKEVNANYNNSTNNVTISWDYDDKTENIYFVIYRSIKNNSVRKYRTITNDAGRQFIDTDINSSNEIYNYAIKVFDKQGRESILSEQKKVTVK